MLSPPEVRLQTDGALASLSVGSFSFRLESVQIFDGLLLNKARLKGGRRPPVALILWPRQQFAVTCCRVI